MKCFAAIALIALCSSAVFAQDIDITGVLEPGSFAIHGSVAAQVDTSRMLTARFTPTYEFATITIPIPSQASDWRNEAALSFDFVSDSAIRWELIIHNGQGASAVFRLQPLPGVAVHAVIPLRFATRDFMNNQIRSGYAISNWGSHADLSNVTSLEIRCRPNAPVTLQVGKFSVTQTVPKDDVIEKQVVIDRFGQWLGTNWPGKPHNEAELKRVWKMEDAQQHPDDKKTTHLTEAPFAGNATGFFHTEEHDGRWWFVDGEGAPFVSIGMDCVNMTMDTPVEGREFLFPNLLLEQHGFINYYKENIKLRYPGVTWMEQWKAAQYRRLHDWGFNTIANWSDERFSYMPKMAFTVNAELGRSWKRWQEFPDVYSEEFQKSVRDEAQKKCKKYANESLLLGYFIGNEEHWADRDFIHLILTDEKPSATKAKIQGYLKEHGDTPESHDALVEMLARQYFSVISDAIHEADPHHLVLGIRWAGHAPDAVLRANDVFDVFSINIYRFEPDAEQLSHIFELTHKPILIGEFHFGAPERGMAPSLVAVRDQQQRGVAYRYFVEHSLALPMVVGTHYFQYLDEPVTGRFDGENYNCGFVSVTDQPYEALVSASHATADVAIAVHAGKLPPFDTKASVLP